MNPVAFAIAYTKWHYGRALLDIIRVWGNFLWLSMHFFSTGTLALTLFSPFRRMHEEYPAKGHINPGYFAGTMFINTIMRMIGALVRLLFIALSLTAFTLLIVSGILFISFWIITPFALISLITLGTNLTFMN